ncbi:hypothetical protein GCM10008107_07140 [Psychrosphaera saromensis]|uniref:UPF0208 membrane protein YfbV n=1 Tax=Psychrosphaera saromensis TaxID=716813 RepID=A0A2S7UXC0_9GAMM|nr:DUF412 family protein [Psychrosphaera saromensis]PQJ54378.1 hypothetical protein BTO11_12400 [Psychrosphaera saromensis]GHB60466.1 hypothetical protein GCM10008107_07140 [Psychrosphaera saromensis]GLQ14588.1 hypothetical protein GCM10007917_20430 [Psychrosphaera saromensis]
MIVILVTTLNAGYKFSQTWPKKEPYLLSFPQTGYIKLADLSLTVAPVIAFITAWLQLSYIGMESLNTALAMSLLILSLPVHGYYLLGKQAEARLSSGLKSWYKEIEEQLQKSNKLIKEGDVKKSNSQKLTYMDLAKLLKVRFERG